MANVDDLNGPIKSGKEAGLASDDLRKAEAALMKANANVVPREAVARTDVSEERMQAPSKVATPAKAVFEERVEAQSESTVTERAQELAIGIAKDLRIKRSKAKTHKEGRLQKNNLIQNKRVI